MLDDTWQKQGSQSLFPELEWNKPERRNQAGKLLIVGGDMHNLVAPASTFEAVKKIGIGDVKIVLPSKAKRFLPKDMLSQFIFLPSTATGEFSLDGENELLEQAAWADSILLPGDSGRNSQTAILFQNLLTAYVERIIITRDALDTMSSSPTEMLQRPRTTLIASFAQLQKLIKNYGDTTPLAYSMDLVKLVESLQKFTSHTMADIVTLHLDQIIVASGGKVSTTKLIKPVDESTKWRLTTASHAACYQTWNPKKPFESLSHISYLVSQIV